MAEEVGGFFASLKLQADQASFQRGIGSIKGVGDELARLVKIGLGIAGVTIGIKELLNAANKQGQLLLTANYLQMNADAVTTWSGAIKEAGGNSSAFIDSIKGLHQNLVRLKEEGMDPGNKFFQNIAQLGVNPGDLVNMTQDQQVRTLMNAARNSKNPNLANDLILQLLGPDALNAVLYSRATGRSLDQMRGEAAKAIYNPNRAGALAGMGQLRQAGGKFEGMWEAFSSKFIADLAPELKRLNDWLGQHQDEISQMIDAMAKLAAALVINVAVPVTKMMTGKMTSEDWFGKNNRGLPWTAQYWVDFWNMGKNIFSGHPDAPLPLLGKDVKITIEDKTQGGVKVTPTGVQDLHKAADTVTQQR
jgi:hypothetical protein